MIVEGACSGGDQDAMGFSVGLMDRLAGSKDDDLAAGKVRKREAGNVEERGVRIRGLQNVQW
jgi:hypothetical protein